MRGNLLYGKRSQLQRRVAALEISEEPTYRVIIHGFSSQNEVPMVRLLRKRYKMLGLREARLKIKEDPIVLTKLSKTAVREVESMMLSQTTTLEIKDDSRQKEILLEQCPNDKQAIEVLRQVLGVNLAAAQLVVTKAPIIIAENDGREKKEELIRALLQSGARMRWV
jgi:ribosomal protein L7/L12